MFELLRFKNSGQEYWWLEGKSVSNDRFIECCGGNVIARGKVF
jgi:hypothetical protein